MCACHCVRAVAVERALGVIAAHLAAAGARDRDGVATAAEGDAAQAGTTVVIHYVRVESVLLETVPSAFVAPPNPQPCFLVSINILQVFFITCQPPQP